MSGDIFGYNNDIDVNMNTSKSSEGYFASVPLDSPSGISGAGYKRCGTIIRNGHGKQHLVVMCLLKAEYLLMGAWYLSLLVKTFIVAWTTFQCNDDSIAQCIMLKWFACFIARISLKNYAASNNATYIFNQPSCRFVFGHHCAYRYHGIWWDKSTSKCRVQS